MSLPFVEVVAPSRLHFGMFSFGHAEGRQFGGAGVMVDRPGLRLRIVAADRFAATGPLAPRVESVVRRLADRWGDSAPPTCRIEVIDAPPEHVGLGTGTQLSLAVAAGLHALHCGAPLEPLALAELSGRGERSAVGTYGFLHGGFLVESGKLAGETLAPLEHRLGLPEDWRFVLVFPAEKHGLSGEAEQAAFGRLPPVPPEVTDQLCREVNLEMVPAAKSGQFDRFSRSVWRFGRQAGMCFAAVQGGPFAGPRIERLVEAIRACGVEGVGQSSWGPLVFAVVENDRSAGRLAEALQQHLEKDDTLLVAKPNATGARIARGTADG